MDPKSKQAFLTLSKQLQDFDQPYTTKPVVRTAPPNARVPINPESGHRYVQFLPQSMYPALADGFILEDPTSDLASYPSDPLDRDVFDQLLQLYQTNTWKQIMNAVPNNDTREMWAIESSMRACIWDACVHFQRPTHEAVQDALLTRLHHMVPSKDFKQVIQLSMIEEAIQACDSIINPSGQ